MQIRSPHLYLLLRWGEWEGMEVGVLCVVVVGRWEVSGSGPSHPPPPHPDPDSDSESEAEAERARARVFD